MSVDIRTTEPSPATHEGPDNPLSFACASLKRLEPTLADGNVLFQ